MLKLNVILAALLVAPLFAGADDMKAISVTGGMLFTFDVTKDKKLSKPGVTVLNLKTGKKSKYGGEEYSTKWADSNSTIEIEGVNKIEIKSSPKARAGFSGEGMDIVLSNDGSATATGIVDHGEPHSNLKWKTYAGGISINGGGFQSTIELMINSERGQRDSLLRAMFAGANDNDLKIESRKMNASDLNCAKVPGPRIAYRCQVTVEIIESGKVRLSPEAIANFNKGVAAMKKAAAEGR